MLIALELAGFKSFADKTRFDFPDGITVIVGPNGSGKSNVVDAIKWVLGAQSAKAMRGKEMLDVIFKGSSTSTRKPANSAEATLVFDNSAKQLAVDADEVQVTRRVYRSGESEYLINNQACRLRDIKDLFRGTGVGVDAYSLIEQGKVDRMLQASPKDRRVIFEEAAGISRFNAKKAEAQRRLQRVDQNLVRLKDIVDEVHTRLSSLKGQATKAQRYREMTSRLQTIRLRLGWTEYRDLVDSTDSLAEQLEGLQSDEQVKHLEQEEARQAAQQAELQLHQVATACQDVEARLQDTLQRIAVSQNQQNSLWQRIGENREEQTRQSARLVALRQRADSLQDELSSVRQQNSDAQNAFDVAKRQADACDQKTQRLRQQLTERQREHDALRKQQMQLLRDASEKSSEMARQKNQLSDLQQSIYRIEKQLESQQAGEQETRKAAEQAALRLKQIHQQNASADEELQRVKATLEENSSTLAKYQEQAAILNGRLQGAHQRLEILQQLQQHLEGVDSGARHVLSLKRSSSEAAYQSIHGLVADLLEVNVDLAPLIDTALGHAANTLIVEDGQMFQLARAGQLDVPGRLSMLRMDRIPNRRFGEKVQLDGVRGVLGRADRLVKFAERFGPVFRYLLGTTWLVESLDVALELGHFRGAGLRFVSADCQLVEADGTLTIGSLQSTSGLVSRRSEIQNAEQELAELQSTHRQLQEKIEKVTAHIDSIKPTVEHCEANARQLSSKFAHQQAVAQTAVGKLDEIEHQAGKLGEELSGHRAQKADLEPAIEQASEAVAQTQQQLGLVEQQLTEYEERVREYDRQLAASADEQTAAKVELARAEQKLEASTIALEQCTRNQHERHAAVREAAQELDRLRTKQRSAELEILRLTSLLAEDFLIAEREESKLEQLAAEAGELRNRRSATAKQLDAASRTLDKITQRIQSVEADLQRSQQSSQELLKRFADEYQIDYEQLSAAELIEDPAQRQAMDEEASQLRKDIASVGEINMAALAELDELQQRYDYLNTQYEDLQAAKESLQRIIQKINADSRRLFLETLEIIRENFQKLYRKSFGGGAADIVLEEGADVLEGGIDIIATPPGKTELSNSLLSGGEKALTAVALLLAIFQYRPSPFCVLDEVDAPFDEANIGRFVSVLSEFLDWTKFIIVTHSKKTMTASNTLYGVTMQESGVSKQVAVRFEDVNEKGEIVNERTGGRRAA
jgi:chromosome segregation protein